MVVKNNSIRICDNIYTKEELKKHDELIESIVNINKDSVMNVFESVDETLVKTAFHTIIHTIPKRPMQVESLLSLFSLLSKKFEFDKNTDLPEIVKNIFVQKEIIPGKPMRQYNDTDKILYGRGFGKIEKAIKDDDLETFIKISSEPGFDCNHGYEINKIIVDDSNDNEEEEEEEDDTENEEEEDDDDYKPDNVFEIFNESYYQRLETVSYIKLMAFFGSIKCFKHAVLTGEYKIGEEEGLNKYAIAGGNNEIIHILQNKGVSFNECFAIASHFYQNELCDWLLMHFQCEPIRLPLILNYKLILFLVNNTNFLEDNTDKNILSRFYENDQTELVKCLLETDKFNVNATDSSDHTIMDKALGNEDIDFIKYLYETRLAKVSENAINEASYLGNLEIIKYLYETCHAKVCEKAINNASYNGNLEIVKYLYETCHAKASDNAMNIASISGNLEIVKYLYETCHLRVSANALFNASDNSHFEIVKYLCETCQCGISAKAIRVAKTEEIKEYLLSKIKKPSDFDLDICKAASEGKLENVKLLVEQCYANVETKDESGRTPINNASKNGHLEIVKYLYETCHANIETKDKNGWTPINNASRQGNLEVVKYLYETCYANPETKDGRGNTPIYNASANGHLEVVKYLYETCHADVKIKYDYMNGRTPIIAASQNGHLDVVKYLFETCHADAVTESWGGESPISRAKTEEIKEYFNSVFADKPSDLESDIYEACKKGKLADVKFFVERCHVNIEEEGEKCRSTPLEIASKNGHLEIVKYLYETCHAEIKNRPFRKAGTDEIQNYFNSKFADKPSDFKSSISEACANGNLANVQYLVERYHSKFKGECKEITIASEKGHLEIVKYLVEQCHVDFETKDDDGNTPITKALDNHHYEIVEYLCGAYRIHKK